MAKAKKKVEDSKTNIIYSTYQFIIKERVQFILGLTIVLTVLFLGLSLISFFFTGAADQSRLENNSWLSLITSDNQIENWTGALGAMAADLLINKWFGVSSFFILIFFFVLGLRLLKSKEINLTTSFFICFTGLIWGSLTLGYLFVNDAIKDPYLFWSGTHGYYMSQWLLGVIGPLGTPILIFGTFLTFMTITTKSTVTVIRNAISLTALIKNGGKILPQEQEKPFSINQPIVEETIESPSFTPIEPERPIIITEQEFEPTPPEPTPVTATEPAITVATPTPADGPTFKIEAAEVPEEVDPTALANYDPTLDLSQYKYPTIDLLTKHDNGDTAINMAEQTSNKNRIIETLENYGIGISTITATVGPTITLYEIVPKPGVRISKIKNLEDDIALSLAALGIRIIAPIPGRGTIGIEVPNKESKVVSMHSLIASKKFQESKFDLPVAFGKTISNEVYMIDLCKMPHMLVAGATGQGKSVGLNAIITSLLYKKHPSQLKFVLIDPKKVEFNIYSHIERHFLAKLPGGEDAIITDVTKVVETLKSLTIEMDSRYDLLKKAQVRNIKEYNERFISRKLNPNNGHRYLPYIVVIIDEFGDLIMTAGKEVELPIARIAQLARAIGIHMIIATQRPSTNIITGTIKANFPARVAFRVASMIDSRTILDSPGANQLIGRGDMLFVQGSDTVRVQCAFVDTPEVEAISDYIGEQQGYATAYELPECPGDESGADLTSIDLAQRDPMFEDSAHLVVIHQQGSTSLIQRKLAIGYNRAGRIIDQLEAAGIIGPFEGSKARQVLIQDEMQLQNVLDTLKSKQ